MHAEETAVGNRPRVRDREPTRTLPAADHTGSAIPDYARPQLRKLVGRIAAREHVEHVLELRPRQVGERVGAAHELVQVVDGDLLVSRDRDDLLREHVERIARDDRLLDRPLEHPLRDDSRFEQVGAELREDAALRDGAELVPGAADALQPARDGLRRLDLQDEVDGAHIDPELERRRGDEAWDLPRLEQLLDLGALRAGKRAVVRAGDLFLRQLVEPKGEALGEAAVVDEQDRGAVLAHQTQQLRIDRGPDRLLRAFAARPQQVAGRLAGGLAHVLQRHDHLQVELLRDPGVDELDLARP